MKELEPIVPSVTRNPTTSCVLKSKKPYALSTSTKVPGLWKLEGLVLGLT
ncbi:unnamed protein product, partial [Didymodactylos carnosus]